MGGVRLVELQRHGEEVQQLKRTKSELVALHLQLEQEVAQKEEEITRLQQKCQHLVSAVCSDNLLIYMYSGTSTHSGDTLGTRTSVP